MEDNKINFLIFFLIIFNCFFNIFFVNQYNLPDGLLHFRRYDLLITKQLPEDFFQYLKDFDMYNISFISSVITQLFPSFSNDCIIEWKNNTVLADSCNHKFFLSLYFKYKGFGYDTQLYDYSKIYFSPDNIALFIYLFLIILSIFIIFIKVIKNTNFFYMGVFFLYFPSVSSNFGYISPNILSSFGQLFLFLLFLNKKYISYLLIAFFLTFIDFQNLSNIILISLFLFVYTIEKIKIIKIDYLLLIFLYLIIFFFIVYFKSSGLLDYFLQIFFPEVRQDYSYLNLGNHNFFKSLITLFLSIYYMGGSMTHPAFLLEYFIFLLLILFFIFDTFIKKSKVSNNVYIENSKKYLVIGIFTALIILVIFQNISQGRYHLYLLLPILFFYANKIKEVKSFLLIVSFLFLLNNLKLIKFVATGII